MAKNTTLVQKTLLVKYHLLKKTGREIELLFGQCSLCNRENLIIVSVNTIQTEGLGDFFKNLGKKGLKVSKKMVKNVLKNPGRALEVGANTGTAFAPRSPKASSPSLPEVISFYHTAEGQYLGKFVYFILYEWNKKQIDYTRQHHLKIKYWFKTEALKIYKWCE